MQLLIYQDIKIKEKILVELWRDAKVKRDHFLRPSFVNRIECNG